MHYQSICREATVSNLLYMSGLALYKKAAQSVLQSCRRLLTCLQTCLIEPNCVFLQLTSNAGLLPALVPLVITRPELHLLAVPTLVVVDNKAFVLEGRVPQHHRIPVPLGNPVRPTKVRVTTPELSKSSIPVFVVINDDAVLAGRRRLEQAGPARAAVEQELLPAAVFALPQLHPLPVAEAIVVN